jgi:hypothetical protein
MKKMLLMMAAAIFAGALFSAEAYDAKHVNAKSVVIQWRYAPWWVSPTNCCECGDNNVFLADGDIVISTISNGIVARRDTIYKREQGLASYANFDLTGTRVAFYRQGKAGGSCAQVNGGKSYISITNTNGAGLRNLCELPGPPGPLDGAALDWPAGEWIYYCRPNAQTTAGDPRALNTVDVWKVNATDGTTSRVCNFPDVNGNPTKCQYWRRFSLDLTATHMGGQSVGYGGCSDNANFAGGNGVWNFPPTNCQLQGAMICGVPACNAAISPSGTIVGHYMGDMHQDLWLTSVSTCKQLIPGTTADPYGRTNLHTALEVWAGDSIGKGAEEIHWAHNSDKWVLQNIGWWGHAAQIAYTCNQVAANWVDKVAINITKHPLPAKLTDPSFPGGVQPNEMVWNYTTGDLWIDDPVNNPQKNKYEDLQGVWHAVPGATAVESPLTGASRNASPAIFSGSRIRVQVSGNGPWEIAISAANGRMIRSQRGAGPEARIAMSGLGAGVYLMRISSRSGTDLQRFVVR